MIKEMRSTKNLNGIKILFGKMIILKGTEKTKSSLTLILVSIITGMT